MNIEKVSHDKNFPYRITDSWGGSICCTKRDLEELRSLINFRLEDEQPNPRPRIDGSVGIGGQMVRRMIDAYEGKRR